MRNKKGFTLIEVLIVIVIIAILAALILPRMLAMPEKAYVAEANQLLGTMIRAQQARLDTGTSFVAIADNTTVADWNKLGMQPPGASVASGPGAKFNYTCASPNCLAARNSQANKTVQLSTAGAWTCGSDYTAMTNGGCTLS